MSACTSSGHWGRLGVGSSGRGAEITALPRSGELEVSFRTRLPAGCPEVLQIRVALMPMAGEHLRIFAGALVSPLAMGSKS
jgi:hypothetical protein